MQAKKEINVSLGRRLQQTREHRGLTQEKLAELLEVGVQHISNIERGVTGISLTALSRACELLDVSADYLLLGTSSAHHAGSIDARIEELPWKEAELASESINRLLDAISVAMSHAVATY